jgi:hypothetical protein
VYCGRCLEMDLHVMVLLTDKNIECVDFKTETLRVEKLRRERNEVFTKLKELYIRFGNRCRKQLTQSTSRRNISLTASGSKHLLSRGLLARLVLRRWRWMHYIPPKHRLTFNGLHGVIFQKVVFFVTTSMRTSDTATLIFLHTENTLWRIWSRQELWRH